MARPQTEAGFVMVALDLFAALMAADIPNRGAIVLAEVLLQTYGPRKARRGVRAVHIDPAQIEHYTGLHRNNARKAIRELVAANILNPQSDGAYKFNKDYETWTPGGQRMTDRLGGGVLRFAASALARHGFTNESASDPIQRDFPSTNGPIPGDSSPKDFPNPAGLGSVGSCQSPGIGADVDAMGSSIGSAGARAPEDLENRDQKDSLSGEWVSDVPMDDAEKRLIAFADYVTSEIFRIKESDGTADANASRRLRCIIRGLSERAVLYHASEVAARRDINKPMAYFAKLCREGLSEPPRGYMAPSPSGGPAARPKPTAEELERITAAIDAEQAKYRAARPASRSKPDGSR